MLLSLRLHVSPQDSATMQFCANKLDKKDFFGKSDPFMVFYRSNEDGTWVTGVVVFHHSSEAASASAAGGPLTHSYTLEM